MRVYIYVYVDVYVYIYIFIFLHIPPEILLCRSLEAVSGSPLGVRNAHAKLMQRSPARGPAQEGPIRRKVGQGGYRF